MPYPGPALFPGPDTYPGFPTGTFTGGPADSWTLIADFGGTLVDISTDVIGSITGEQQKRTTELEPAQPGTLTFTLRNPKGWYTPDNPGSPYWPNMALQTPITWTVTKNSFTQTMFIGSIDSIAPAFTQAAKTGTVTITCSDNLGAASRQTLKSDINERWNGIAKRVGATSDVWMFGEDDGAAQWANTGIGGLGLPALRVKASSGRGQAARDEADGLIVEGAVTITDTNGVAPVILAQHAPGQTSMMAWFKWDVPPPYLPDYDMLLSGRRGGTDDDTDGSIIWSLRWAESGVGTGIFQLELRDSNNALVSAIPHVIADGAWHDIWVWNYAPGLTGFYFDNSKFTITGGFDLSDQEYLIAGGQMNPLVKGAQGHCMTATFAALAVTTTVDPGIEQYTQTGSTMSATDRWNDLMVWRTYGGSQAIIGTDSRDVAVKSSMGRPQLDCLNEVALTIGGAVWHNPAGNQVELLTGPQWRPQAVTAVVTLELDDDIDAGHEWGLSLSDSPTRITATCPAGQVTYIAPGSETNGIRDGGSFDTTAATVADAKSIAAWQVGRVKRLSLSRFGIDVASAVNGPILWPALLTMRPGARLHVINIDQGIFGVSTFDVHVLGWTVEIGPEIALWTFDCLPADSPAEFTVGDPVYGRVGWNDGEAICSVLSASATSLTITAVAHPLTTDPAAYPLTLLIDGEIITVTGPPASTVSPQTVTITRASHGTVPTAHLGGRSIYMYPDVRVGP